MASDPSPSRFHHRLRWAGVFALLTLALLWLAWWRVAEHQLAARLAAMRAAGEPLEPQDFVQPQLPPEQNAATYYLQAFKSIQRSALPPSASDPSSGLSPPYSKSWYDASEAAVAADRTALTLARQARGLDHADWGHIYGLEVQWETNRQFNSSTTYLSSPLRTMVEGIDPLDALLCDSAALAHHQGNDAQAIEYMCDAMSLVETLSQGTGIIGAQVSATIDEITLPRLGQILPDLQISRDGDASAPHAVNEATLRRIMASLLDEQKLQVRARAAIQMRRSEAFAHLREIRARSTVSRPMLDLQAAQFFDAIEQDMAALSLNDLSSAMTMFRKVPMIEQEYSPLLPYSPGAAHGYVQTEFTHMAFRRATAMAIAVRLYYVDHQRWPARLEDLVPAYLTAVPINPFMPGQQPLGYTTDPLHDGTFMPMIFLPTGPSAKNIPPAGWTFGFAAGSLWCSLSSLNSTSPATTPTSAAQQAH